VADPFGRPTPYVTKGSWWFLIFPLGCVGIALLAKRGVDVVIFGWDVVDIHGFFTGLSLSGTWLVFCLWLIAVIDLGVRLYSASQHKPFVALPGNISLPTPWLRWLVIAGFLIGLPVGHFLW